MRYLLSFILLLAATTVPRANDLDDLPDVACAQATSDVERQHLGCRDPGRPPTQWQSAPPLDRSEDD
ncbi:MAG: hypothetical protein PGN34_13520 [Methylobacterium frigidaeris]